MSLPSFEELWEKLCSADESTEIEAKRAEEFGKSVLATISAFANEPLALIVVRELRAIDNAAYRSINHVDTLTASGRLRRLRDSGLLEQKGKGAATYYLPGRRLLAALGSLTTSEPLRTESDSLRPEFPPLRPELTALAPGGSPLAHGVPPLAHGVPPLRTEFEALRSEVPETVRGQLERLGRRATPEELDNVLISLAAWRPMTLEELSHLTGRDAAHLRSRNIKRLLTEGRLAYTHPDEPNHPEQKYTVGTNT